MCPLGYSRRWTTPMWEEPENVLGMHKYWVSAGRGGLDSNDKD